MLSEEEKKAIENLKDFKSISILYGNKFVMFLEQLKKYQEATNTILNLVTKLQKENKEKDKQIDLSAEFIKNNMSEKKIINEICIKGKCNNEECHEDDLKECIKLHFEKLAKEKGE